MLLEHHCAERRRQSQGHEGREADRYGNRQGELFIEDARHAAEEGNRHEYGRKDDSDGDNRALYFVHGAFRRIDRRQAFFHMLLDVLDDDDSIIDDQADGQYHGEQCQCIDRKVKNQERTKRTNKRYRYSEQRDNRCAPVLQEDENNENDEQQGFNERLQNFLDGGTDVIRRIENLRHLESRRQCRLSFIKDLTNLGNRRHGVSITREVDAETDGRIAFILRNDRFGLLARFNLRDILEADKLAVAI